MSFLLDALRKSERQRNLGETPTIHIAPYDDIKITNKPWRRYGFYLVIILIILAIWLWFLFTAEERGAGTTVTGAAGTQSAALAETETVTPSISESASEVESDGGNAEFSLPPLRTPEPQSSTVQARSPSEPRSSGALSNDLPSALSAETPQTAVTTESLLSAAEQGSSAGSDNPDEASAERLAALKQRLATARSQRQQEDAPVAAETAVSASADESSENSQPDAEPEWQPAQPRLLDYFELPVTVRQQLPTLKRSIQVYDADPEKRFVVINQERLHEGDSVGEVKVVEIRRDSLVLDYQEYRFKYQ